MEEDKTNERPFISSTRSLLQSNATASCQGIPITAFERVFVVDFFGKPDYVTEQEILQMEISISTAMLIVFDCMAASAEFILDKVYVDRNFINAFGAQNYSRIGNPTPLDQAFSWIVKVDGTSNILASNQPIFADDSAEQRNETNTVIGTQPPSGNFCDACPLPLQSHFLRVLSAMIESDTTLTRR